MKSEEEFSLKSVVLEKCKTPSNLKSLDLPIEESLFSPNNSELVLDKYDPISK